MSYCTCDYHQEQNKKSEWDVSGHGIQWTGDDFFKAKEMAMKRKIIVEKQTDAYFVGIETTNEHGTAKHGMSLTENELKELRDNLNSIMK